MRDFNKLIGHNIIQWIGAEIALSEGINGGPVIWNDFTVPYLQFDRLDAFLDDGSVFTILSQLDDGSDWFGIHSPSKVDQQLSTEPYNAGSIYRTRDVTELPVGRVLAANAKTDESDNVLELSISISNLKIRLVSGEVYENGDGSYRIEFINESLLVQISN